MLFRSGFVQWFIPFAVQLIPGGLFAIGVPLFLKESPRWLMSRNRREEAIENLCASLVLLSSFASRSNRLFHTQYLRQLDRNDPYIVEEINMIDIQIEHDITAVGPGFWGPFRQLFTNWHLTKRLLICTSLFIWQNGTGIVSFAQTCSLLTSL